MVILRSVSRVMAILRAFAIYTEKKIKVGSTLVSVRFWNLCSVACTLSFPGLGTYYITHIMFYKHQLH